MRAPPRTPAGDPAGRALCIAAAIGLAVAASGCALPIQAEMDRASDAARFATRYDHPEGVEANLLDRALARCGTKTAAAESGCVKAAVVGAGLTPRGLAALVPGCRVGLDCHYDRATHDRLGFVSATATEFVRRWRVDIDLRKPAADVAQVPIAVSDRDDFEPPKPAPG